MWRASHSEFGSATSGTTAQYSASRRDSGRVGPGGVEPRGESLDGWQDKRVSQTRWPQGEPRQLTNLSAKMTAGLADARNRPGPHGQGQRATPRLRAGDSHIQTCRW